MSEKVLYVDDDANILAAYSRMLRKDFKIDTAEGGREGLDRIAEAGPFAVVVADMRMPGMDGVEFLGLVKDRCGESVRIMLTGNADLETAIQAVNEGEIFRFLTKPCPKEQLVKAVRAGMAQYRLIVAERQLLAETLNGSVTVLTEILSLVNPIAFGQGVRIRRYVRQMVDRLGLSDPWQYEVAATLSQIGCVTLDGDLLKKVHVGQALTPQEQQRYDSHAEIAGKLLVNIPRLGDIAQMVRRQRQPFDSQAVESGGDQPDRVSIGAQILKVILDFDQIASHGTAAREAIAQMRNRQGQYNPRIIETLESLDIEPAKSQRKALNVAQLEVYMILDEDVKASNGNLLVTRGRELTIPVLEHLRRWASGIGVKQPIRVLVPQYEPAPEPVAAGREV